jgi:hypothetical protein
MQLQTMWEAFATSSTTLSANCRTFAIAAIALVWIFHTKKADGTYELPLVLIEAIRFVVLSMIFDFAQYGYKSLAYLRLAHKTEKKAEAEFPISDDLNNKSTDDLEKISSNKIAKDLILEKRREMDVEVDSLWNFITNFLFYAKVVVLGLAYYQIMMYLNEAVLKAAS